MENSDPDIDSTITIAIQNFDLVDLFSLQRLNILNVLKSEYTYALLGSYPESSIEVQLIEAPDAVLQVNLYNAAFSGTVPPIRNNLSKQELFIYFLSFSDRCQ